MRLVRADTVKALRLAVVFLDELADLQQRMENKAHTDEDKSTVSMAVYIALRVAVDQYKTMLTTVPNETLTIIEEIIEAGVTVENMSRQKKNRLEIN